MILEHDFDETGSWLGGCTIGRGIGGFIFSFFFLVFNVSARTTTLFDAFIAWQERVVSGGRTGAAFLGGMVIRLVHNLLYIRSPGRTMAGEAWLGWLSIVYLKRARACLAPFLLLLLPPRRHFTYYFLLNGHRVVKVEVVGNGPYLYILYNEWMEMSW